jgi:integrase
MGTLRLVLASAVEDGLLKANPALGVRLGGIGAKPAHAGQSEEERARVLTPEEIRKLIQATSEGQRRLLVRLVAATGLRISEALGLRWSDLDVAARSGSVAGRVRGGRYGAVKSAQGIRAVPIPANLARDLAAHRLASRWSADADYVFATRNGTARTRERTYGWLHDAVEKAGVPWPGGWHGLRRSCASAWLAAGVPLATVAQLLGHRPDVTLRAYAHGRANDLPTGEALAAAVGAV